ncbi:MAG: site-specific recombinase XerD [Myxococcota bacterium]|jgi:site-specific recombinase XerD
MSHFRGPTNAGHLIDRFAKYQRRTRGLRDRTLEGYSHIVRLLLRDVFGEKQIEIGTLDSAEVSRFFHSMCGRYSPHSMNNVRSGLRSFFGFLRAEGLADERLERSLPTLPSWQQATLPRCLSDTQLRQVLASFDTSTSSCPSHRKGAAGRLKCRTAALPRRNTAAKPTSANPGSEAAPESAA